MPSHRNGGGTVRGGGITRTGSEQLRRAPVNAATIAVRHDGRMRERYLRIGRRRGKQKAKVAVANTPAGVIWHMLTHGTEYCTQDGELTQGSLESSSAETAWRKCRAGCLQRTSPHV